LHYAETLRHWRERFLREREAIAALYDERFCRMWEVYPCMSELAFRHLDCMVFQIQLTKRVDALPLTRDYIYDLEQTPPLSMARRAAG
jgi:cyclopropane-fatty-acyl-phospholipid synthase